jgi:tRNA threonylcarbamoyladenosine biosynthesis protein TsaE
MDLDFISESPEQTVELGRRIGQSLKGGEVIALCGPLGSGKTHLIKGVVAGAGGQECSRVTSPTFIIVNEYAGRFDIYHIDAYRLKSVDEFEMIGFDDFCHPHSVILIEWADKIESALQAMDYIRIEMAHAGKTQRKIRIQNAPVYIRC